MFSPFALPPDAASQAAAHEIINKVHAYMRAHPNSELHRCGKMFGVLIYKDEGGRMKDEKFLAAFSAQLDGSYYHEGFVPPVYKMPTQPIGTSKEESRRLQRLLFADYRLLNSKGESKNLLDIFRNERPILSPDEWFSGKDRQRESLPPSGAGECCAPKLLQYAFANGLSPLSMAEFWVGASPKNEIRQEGMFYAPCSGRCVPILRYMLGGMNIEAPEREHDETLCRQTKIIFEDSWLMVVDKPSGLLSVPGKEEQVSLVSYLAQERNLPYLQAAHRLDQDTSGLLVLAKTPEVYKTLQAYFQRRDILKRYEAVLAGEGARNMADEGLISLPLLPNPYDRPRQMVDEAHGKPAITRYRVRERRLDDTVFIDFYPQTGRTHQLRIHAAHPNGLNAPIAGDRLYGGQAASRLMLHAAEISFLHPITQEKMHFCIPSYF